MSSRRFPPSAHVFGWPCTYDWPLGGNKTCRVRDRNNAHRFNGDEAAVKAYQWAIRNGTAATEDHKHITHVRKERAAGREKGGEARIEYDDNVSLLLSLVLEYSNSDHSQRWRPMSITSREHDS
jgi:hypothetical protein